MTPDTAAVDPFEPTRAALQARMDAIDPEAYARTRNHLEGAVTRLSPYLTHGMVTLPEVLKQLQRRQPVHPKHRLIFEFAWREYFRHVWEHEGDGILRSLHPGVLPDEAYAPALPRDLIEARTGLAAIDGAVRELYATGWIHNHARLWLASYIVHLRKVHWRSGADWLYAHLLDGDLASNHLSWQWVAGTASRKPYLFNAGNVERYAPASWHGAGTPLDQPYEALELIARTAGRSIETRPAGEGVAPPGLADGPGEDLDRPDADAVQGRPVWLVHPWSLADPPAGLPGDLVRVGVVIDDVHARLPWTAARWRFTMRRMRELCGRPSDRVWRLAAAELRTALQPAASVHGIDDPHLAGALAPWGLAAPARLFEPPTRRCTSFSQFWDRAILRPAEAMPEGEVTRPT